MNALWHPRRIPAPRLVGIIATTVLRHTQACVIVAKSLQDHPQLAHEAVERDKRPRRSRAICFNLYKVRHHEGTRIRTPITVDSTSLPSRSPRDHEVSFDFPRYTLRKLTIY